MNDTLKQVFDEIHAEEELKERTKEYIFQKTNGYTGRKKTRFRYWIPAAACLAFLLWGGQRLYFTSAAEISIDVNPSIELDINRFDRVISVDGYNEDGERLADRLDIRNMDYTEAVEQILQNEEVADLLSDGAFMTIGVIGSNEAKAAQILSELQSCTAEEENTYCYCAHPDEVEDAHSMGMSCGKYKAYLELKALDPGVTPEEVQGMTMREIYDRIAGLSGGASGQSGTDSNGASGQNGTGSSGASGQAGTDSSSQESGGNGVRGHEEEYEEHGHHGSGYGREHENHR